MGADSFLRFSRHEFPWMGPPYRVVYVEGTMYNFEFGRTIPCYKCEQQCIHNCWINIHQRTEDGYEFSSWGLVKRVSMHEWTWDHAKFIVTKLRGDEECVAQALIQLLL